MNEADGVFQGGGVKGIALVGALLEFADRGWTNWTNVAGTSAGSIIAAYLAVIFIETKNRPYTVIRKIHEAKSP